MKVLFLLTTLTFGTMNDYYEGMECCEIFSIINVWLNIDHDT